MVKNKILLITFLVTILRIQAKSTSLKYYVYIKDKVNSPYHLDKPLAFLSQKALDRRTKFGIQITEQDLPINPRYLNNIAKIDGVKVLNKSKWLNAVAVEIDNINTLDIIQKMPIVKSVEALTGNLKPQYNSSNTLLEKKPSKSSKYGLGYEQILMLNGLKLHRMGYRGEGMLVAIMDGGFSKVDKLKVFDSLRNEHRLIATKDFVHTHKNFYKTYSHGMQVLSSMASNNNFKLIGTAPKANYILILTEESGSEFPIEEANWVAAVEYADSMGVDIINTSLGYTTFDDPSLNIKKSDLSSNVAIATRGANIAVEKGMVVVVAAGNSGTNKWGVVSVPGDAKNVITVGATGVDRIVADFSSRGNRVKEGVIKPTFTAPGKNVYVESGRDRLTTTNGTSLASPILCGMITCLMQANPSKNPEEIKNALKMSADMNTKPNKEYGYGIPDFYMAHAILGNNHTFNYGNDCNFPIYQVYLPNYLPIRFYSANQQDITIDLICEKTKKSGKKKYKTLAHKTISCDAKQFVTDNLKFRPISKHTVNKQYILEIKTKTKVYRRIFK